MRMGGDYEPRVLRGASLPPISAITLAGDRVADAEPPLLVGGFDLESTLEQDVWRRLLDGLVDGAVYAVFAPSWPLDQIDALGDATPPSRWATTWMVEDPGFWRDLVAPDRVGRSFAWCRDADGVMLIVGKPTETVWGEMALRLAPLRTDG